MFDSSIMRKYFYHYYKYYFQIGIMNIVVENWTLLLEKETFQSYETEVKHPILLIFFIFFTVCQQFLNLLGGLPTFLNSSFSRPHSGQNRNPIHTIILYEENTYLIMICVTSVVILI